jgi:aspartate-semialdehyde dehydrogenase
MKAKIETTLNWYNGLNEIKKWVNENNCDSIHDKFKEYKMSTSWGTFLNQKNVIYYDKNCYYRWHQDIDVTIDLINDFREYIKLKNKQNMEKINKNIIKKRRPTLKTNKKYYNCLEDLKKELDTKNISSITVFMREKKVNQFLSTFLRKNNIIYIDGNGFYKWNSKIPVSMNLINAYRKQYKLISDKHNDSRKIIINNNQPELNFDEVNEPIKTTKTQTRKLKVQRQVNTPNQQNKLGIIRRFLKWLW